MLESLNELVKEHAQDAIINNSAIPNEQNEAAVQAASGSIFDTLKQQLSSGNISSLVDAFKGGNAGGNSLTEQATTTFTDKLAGMGIDAESAKGVAASIIPSIISKFVNKTNDPNDSSFNIQDILSKISGPDGKFQLSDLTNLFSGSHETGATENQTGVTGNQAGTGENQTGATENQTGILDKLKGLFN